MQKILIIAPPLIGDNVMIIPHLEAFSKIQSYTIYFFTSNTTSPLIKNNVKSKITTYSITDEFFMNKNLSVSDKNKIISRINYLNPDMVFDHLGNVNSIKIIQKLLCKKTYGVSVKSNIYKYTLPQKKHIKWMTNSKNASECFSDLYRMANINLKLTYPLLYSKKYFFFRKKTVLINPGAGARIKRWGINRFIKVSELLNKNNIDCRFLVGPSENLYYQKLNKLKYAKLIDGRKYNISVLCKVINSFSVVLTNDSAIMHLSAALNLPTISIFSGGIHNPKKWFPYEKNNKRIFIGDISTKSVYLPNIKWRENISISSIFNATIQLLKDNDCK